MYFSEAKLKNIINKELVEPRWKSGQGQGTRGGGGRVNYSSRYTPNDTVSRNSSVRKENNSNQPEKSVVLSSPTASQVPIKYEATASISSASGMTNGPFVVVTKGVKADISKLGGLAPHAYLNIVQENARENSGTGKTYAQLASSSKNRSSAETQGTSPSGYLSSLDPVLMLSHDSRIPDASGAIKREVGCHQTFTEQSSHFPSEGITITATSEVKNSSLEGDNVQINFIGAGKPQQSFTTPCPSSAHGGSFMARSSSNHSSRSQQIAGPPKENVPVGEHDVPSAGSNEYGESKQERDLPQGSNQYPMVHASPGYGLGLMSTMMESQPPSFDNLQSQARDASRVPSFIVPQPYDFASYYAQFNPSTPDSDGGVSPFHAAGAATKYNMSVPVLPPQASQNAQEGGNTLVVSTSGATAIVTQPAPGVTSNSMAVTQQPVPVFRPPYGIPFPHYPHNVMPYGPYFSPYFIQHFNQSMNNLAFPQQPQAGGVYPAPSWPSPKVSLSQYKPGTSSVNSYSIGVASSYGPYGPSASTAGNSTTNEELNPQQFNENNVYITGQQLSEGSAVWLTPSGKDLSGAQASSVYNIPSQGHLAFPQPQPGHGLFTGIYHTAQGVSATTGHPLLQPSQTMASSVDIAPNVYQQPQHAHVTCPSNNY